MTHIDRPPASPSQNAAALRLPYAAPMDWPAMLAYLESRANAQVESIDWTDLSYQRSVRVGPAVGWLRAAPTPGVDALAIELSASLAPHRDEVASRARALFDLDADTAAIEAHLSADPLLAPLIAQSPGLRLPGAFDPFELAIRAILGQQVSVARASSLSGLLAARFGRPIDTPFPAARLLFPTPAELASASVDDIAKLGMPGARAGAILAMAQSALSGSLERKPGDDLESAVAELTRVKGVGDWTARYIALRALRFSDAFPTGDLGLQKAAYEGAGSGRLTEKQLGARAQAWAPWRGYAAIALWTRTR